MKMRVYNINTALLVKDSNLLALNLIGGYWWDNNTPWPDIHLTKKIATNMADDIFKYAKAASFKMNMGYGVAVCICDMNKATRFFSFTSTALSPSTHFGPSTNFIPKNHLILQMMNRPESRGVLEISERETWHKTYENE